MVNLLAKPVKSLDPMIKPLLLPVAQVMEFYCPPCETAMCQECTSGEHGEHPTVPLKDVVEQHKASLQDQLDAVKKRYDSSIIHYTALHCTLLLTEAQSSFMGSYDRTRV